MLATLRCFPESQGFDPCLNLAHPLHKHIVGKGLGMLDFNDFKSLAQLCETNIGLAPVLEMLAALQFFKNYLMPPLKLINPKLRHM